MASAAPPAKVAKPHTLHGAIATGAKKVAHGTTKVVKGAAKGVAKTVVVIAKHL